VTGVQTCALPISASVVTAVCFEDLYHEIFNELDSTDVFRTLQRWLDARF